MPYENMNPNDNNAPSSLEHLKSAQPKNALVAAKRCLQTWRHKGYAESAFTVTANKAAAFPRAPVGGTGSMPCTN